MALLPSIIFDTTVINALEDGGSASEPMMRALECGYEVFLTAMSERESLPRVPREGGSPLSPWEAALQSPVSLASARGNHSTRRLRSIYASRSRTSKRHGLVPPPSSMHGIRPCWTRLRSFHWLIARYSAACLVFTNLGMSGNAFANLFMGYDDTNSLKEPIGHCLLSGCGKPCSANSAGNSAFTSGSTEV